jgi:hypothetical protein
VTAYVQLISQCTLLIVDLTWIVTGLVDRVHLSPLVNVMRAGACSCLETTSARASMHSAWALMWANMADARYKSFPVNLGPRAGSAREWRLFDEFRHMNSALAAAVTASISTEDHSRFSISRARAPLH